MSLVNKIGGEPDVSPIPAVRSGQYRTYVELAGARVRLNRTVSSTFATGTIYYWWFPVVERITITSVGIGIRANAGGASKSFALGIYADNAGVPGSRVQTTGAVTVASGASTGDNGLYTATSWTLEPGHYWVAFATDTTRNATNWDLDVMQDETTSGNPLVASMGRSTGSFSASTGTQFPPYATQALAWDSGTPLPATATPTLQYTGFAPLISIIFGF